jgi:aconitate hydratase
MGLNVAQKLIQSHLRTGEMHPGEHVAIGIDQTLTQDATGTLVMLTLEAMGLDRTRTELSVQYVDHNLLEVDFRNADDHLFLESASRRFGLWYSRPGNGVSHPLHMTYFARPGGTLLGSDSHTPASGAAGMLAIGAGGFDVAMAIAGEPYHLHMPEIWGVKLTGELPGWVSAKDIILEMLRRHGVAGGRGRVLEYFGPGLDQLSAMDRHVIANMGTELGATTTVFPADEEVHRFFAAHGREAAFKPLHADEDARYDIEEEIDLSKLEPLIAKPSSPGDVVPVREIAGEDIYQAYIGSSANPGFRDFAAAALIVRDKRVPPHVSFDINPTSRDQLAELSREGYLEMLIRAGARLHQAGCNGCIGMGQAPASGRNSLRTVPRNFPGRSGTAEDSVFLCSPETAAASALSGRITDPRTLGRDAPHARHSKRRAVNWDMFETPLNREEASKIELVKGPNIKSLPSFDPLPQKAELPILLKAGDHISTDEILPAGAEVLPFRSNIPKIAEFVLRDIDPSYAKSALKIKETTGHAIIGGSNYGQGSSREHAAIAPRYLGLRAVIAKSYARIHRQNLINYGIVPFEFADANDYGALEPTDRIVIEGWRDAVESDAALTAMLHPKQGKPRPLALKLSLARHDREILCAGGAINLWRKEQASAQQDD